MAFARPEAEAHGEDGDDGGRPWGTFPLVARLHVRAQKVVLRATRLVFGAGTEDDRAVLEAGLGILWWSTRATAGDLRIVSDLLLRTPAIPAHAQLGTTRAAVTVFPAATQNRHPPEDDGPGNRGPAEGAVAALARTASRRRRALSCAQRAVEEAPRELQEGTEVLLPMPS